MFVFGKTSEDLLLGNCSDCYVGYATSDSVRRKASSGGIVTALLAFALKKHIIDGVIVTVSGLHGDLEPQAIIARSEEELLASSGSKYCPVAIGTVIPQIMSHEGKFAVVGLPCHFHGIRKAEMSNETFRKRIVLHVGLFCSNMTSFEGTTCLLRKMQVDRNNVESLSYRRHGWPGEMSVSLKNGEQKNIPYERYWDCFFGNHFFTPWRCLFCTDATNELADISIGDPWLPQFKNQKTGKSLIVLRTQEAADLLRKCSAEGDIVMFPVEREHVKYSQLLTLKSKKRAVATRMSLVRKFGYTVPEIFPPPVSGGVGSILSSVITLTAKKLASSKSFLSILERTPFFILKVHFDLLCAALLVT
jgi:coenzyme F420 hydrogenase subunit beta